MKQFYVYLHCKPDGTPFYVGKGFGDRAYDLNPTRRRNNKHHQRIVKKYSKERILIEVQPCINEQEAFELEVLFILSLREDGIELCNFTDGGEGTAGYVYSEEQMNLRRDIFTSIAFKNNIAAKVKAHWAGMSKSARTKRKAAITSGLSNCDMSVSKETRAKIRTATKARWSAIPEADRNKKLRSISYEDDLLVSDFYQDGESTRQIAARFDVSKETIVKSLKRTKTQIRAVSFWHRSYR